MAILYGKPHQVIRRAAGSWVDGHFVPAAEPAPVAVGLNVQPGDDDDLWAFGEVGALNHRDDKTDHPGDVVVVRGDRYIVLSVDVWDVLPTGGTTHARWHLQPEVPKGPGEV